MLHQRRRPVVSAVNINTDGTRTIVLGP